MKIEIRLTKHIFGDLSLESEYFVGDYGPVKFAKAGLLDDEIKVRIHKPIGTKSLRNLAAEKKNVLIVTDDNTRLTPLHRILPIILSELESASVMPDQITILIGLGTHRPMTRKEIEVKFTKKISDTYTIINHEWNNPNSLYSLGNCDGGFEIVVNTLTQNADLIISVGSIVPHATTGFSGGGKTVMPGVCGEKTIEETHWSALQYEMFDILGNFNNEVRQNIVQICRKIKLDFIVNAILFNTDDVYEIVSGDVEEAHYQGCRFCREVYGIPVAQKADIVITEAYPADIDLRQAIKAICSADLVCKDGGVIILPAECSEGISPQFPNFELYGFSNPEKVFDDVENGIFKEKLLAYTLVAIGRIISKRVKAILVCPTINAEMAKKLGFLSASTLKDAWDLAAKVSNGNNQTIVLREASELLPILIDSNKSTQ